MACTAKLVKSTNLFRLFFVTDCGALKHVLKLCEESYKNTSCFQNLNELNPFFESLNHFRMRVTRDAND